MKIQLNKTAKNEATHLSLFVSNILSTTNLRYPRL